MEWKGIVDGADESVENVVVEAKRLAISRLEFGFSALCKRTKEFRVIDYYCVHHQG